MPALRFAYVLRGPDGAVLDVVSPARALAFDPARDDFVPGLQAVLRSLRPGERRTVTIPAARAYGPHDPALVQRLPRAALPVAELRPGDTFRAGDDVHAPYVRVLEVDADTALLDANHPLAGLDLTFEIETF